MTVATERNVSIHGAHFEHLIATADRFHGVLRILLVLAVGAVVAGRWAVSGRIPVPEAAGALALAVSLLWLFWHRRRAVPTRWAVLAGQLVDGVALCTLILGLPVPLLLGSVSFQLLTVHSGLRFGRRFLVTSAAISLIALGCVVLADGLTAAQPGLLLGLLLATVLLPLYIWRVCEVLLAARYTAVQADARKTRFLATMSHEFRTPLGSILGTADLLASLDLPDHAKRHVVTIRSSAGVLAENVQELLELATIESGRLKPVRTIHSVRDNTEVVFQQFLPAATAKDLAVRLQVADAVPELVWGDAGHIRRALSAVADNAVKFTQRGWVEIHVSFQPASDTGGFLTYRVRDSGPGVPEALQPTLFEPFVEQNDLPDGRPPETGAGLGLTLAKGFAEANGGAIGFHTRHGVGTEFWMTFAVDLVAEFEEGGAQHLVDPVATGSAPARVLVVDDQESNLLICKAMLQSAGYEVSAVSDGALATQLFDSDRPAVAVVDLHMPGTTGWDVIAHIRSAMATTAVPVIVVTADRRAGTRRQLAKAGIADVITKPVSMPTLIEAVGRLCPPPTRKRATALNPLANGYLDNLRSALGNDQVYEQFLASAAADLLRGANALTAEASGDSCDPSRLAAAAHSIVGVAGSLGLTPLKLTAQRVEQEADALFALPDDLAVAVVAVVALTNDALRQLGERDLQVAPTGSVRDVADVATSREERISS